MKKHITLQQFIYQIFLNMKEYNGTDEESAFALSCNREAWEELWVEMKNRFDPGDNRGIELFIHNCAIEEIEAFF